MDEVQNKPVELILSNKEKLGKLGEDLVANLLGAELSEDKYDMFKDMTADGKLIEVKTQSRHPNGCFTVNMKHRNNLQKCVEVDRLIFVEYDATSDIKVFECTDREYGITNTRPTPFEPNGRRMACWPISRMTLLATIDDSNLAATMRGLSASKAFQSK